MTTTVSVEGEGLSCLVAHFSTMAYPLDNPDGVQVRVDGQPMKGHLSSVAGVPTPAVFDPEETDLNLPRMVSYTFFKQVSPGIHQVEVRFAGCCSGAIHLLARSLRTREARCWRCTTVELDDPSGYRRKGGRRVMKVKTRLFATSGILVGFGLTPASRGCSR